MRARLLIALGILLSVLPAHALTLTVASTGVGLGTITCTPSGAGIAPGTAYSCTVTPAYASAISSVTGCGGSGTTTYTGTMPGADCTVTATFIVPGGTGYYISPTGNDANAGTAASPWRTPLHALNCSDVIYASVGAYTATNFGAGKWGTVTCSNGKMARLICATFDGCKITGQTGVTVDKSNWSVQGWEVVNSTNSGFMATPSGAANIHHIAFVNDVVSGANLGGFGSFPTGGFGVDYFAVVGSIAYNAAQGSVHCYSGISVYEPIKFDSVAGTHIYAGGNFSYGNQNPSICQGTAGTDGDGLIFDTFDCSQTGCSTAYDQQAYGADNILVANGGWGLEVQNNSAGSSHAPITMAYNTMWGNRLSSTQFNTALCIDTAINVGLNITLTRNIVQTTASASCPVSNPLYGMFTYQGNATDTITTNWIKTVSGLNCSTSGGGAVCGSNATGTDPAFSAPGIPSAPSCSGKLSVPDCMTTVLSNFTATATGANAYGYRVISLVNAFDPLFPRWLCGEIPPGLVTTSCGTGISLVVSAIH
jgi:hypothetical protein